MKKLISLLSIVFLFSCNNSNTNDIKSILDEKVKYRGSIMSGLFVSYDNNDIIGSQIFDTIPHKVLSDFLIYKETKTNIIDTEYISIPFPKIINNVEVCCVYDTTTIFTEMIKDKKFIITPLFIKKGDFNLYEDLSLCNLYEVISPKSNYIKKRVEIDLPMWGLKIGDYIDKSKIDTSIVRQQREEGNSSRIQFLKSDKSIKISTLEFEKSNKLLITHIEKEDLTETEFNNFIDFIKTKYPFIVINKSVDNGSITHTDYTMNYYGLSIRFRFTDFNMTYSDLKSYSFEISDSYTTTKRIIENEGKKFIYNESNRTIH